jgi:hypothetical protein
MVDSKHGNFRYRGRHCHALKVLNIADFFIKWNGKICNTGSVPGQCVDIIKQYYIDVLNLDPILGNAIDYKNQPGFIKKTFFSKPLAGDIVVFNYGTLGHVGICNWTTFFNFNCFEQNNPIGSPCHFVTHYTYASVIGWIHYEPPTLPKQPLEVALVGSNLTVGESFLGQISKFAQNKLVCHVAQYEYQTPVGMNQDKAYEIIDVLKPKEKFVFLFYQPTELNPYNTSFYDPISDCSISCIPLPADPRTMAFEFAHDLTSYFNQHRGSLPPVDNPDVPSNNSQASDDLIKKKYDSISKFYV